MRVDVLTIFPELFRGFATRGIVEQARNKGALEIRLTQLRGFTGDKHRSVDERPYGGGPGMLFKPEPVFRALELLLGADLPSEPDGPTRLVLLCPQGQILAQTRLQELSECRRVVMLCGRYEGFDERICDSFPWQRISVGDFVVSGGEVPAMLVIDGIARLLPGVLGHAESAQRDSFNAWAGEDGFDHPHYTRPVAYRGCDVPPVLLSGDHGQIESWRRRHAPRRADR